MTVGLELTQYGVYFVCVCVCAAAAEPAATGFDFMSGAAPAEGAEEAGTLGKLRSDSTPTAPAAEARAG